MQPTHNNQSQKPRFIETKYLITVLAVAVTVGFWNLFSINAYSDEKSSPSVVVTLPPQPPTVGADILPPLPTLVPLVDVTIPQLTSGSQAINTSQPGGDQAPVVDNSVDQPLQATPLRVVGIPTEVIVQKKKPVYGNQSVSASSTTNNSSNNGSNSESNSSSTTTKSS